MFILYILLYSLGCAAIPSLSSLILLIRSYQTIVYSPLQTTEEEEKQVTVEIKEESKHSQPSLWIAFLATGITWFIYDFDVSVRVYAIGILPPQPIPNKIRPIPKRKGMKEGEENNENALLL